MYGIITDDGACLIEARLDNCEVTEDGRLRVFLKTSGTTVVPCSRFLKKLGIKASSIEVGEKGPLGQEYHVVIKGPVPAKLPWEHRGRVIIINR